MITTLHFGCFNFFMCLVVIVMTEKRKPCLDQHAAGSNLLSDLSRRQLHIPEGREEASSGRRPPVEGVKPIGRSQRLDLCLSEPRIKCSSGIWVPFSCPWRF